MTLFQRLLVAFFALFSPNKYYTGLNEDTRPQVEKDKDYLHEERAASTVPADPFGNVQIVDNTYYLENQQQTSSCVPHGVGLALAIERKADTGEYVRLSPMFAYRLRNTYPQEGCALQNIYDVYRKFGSPLYTTLPTPKTEAQANAVYLTTAMYNEAKMYKGLNYFTIFDCTNMDTLGSVAQQGHAVPILIYATYPEWAQLYPQVTNPYLTRSSPTAEVKHCVAILPKSGFIRDGKRYFTVQDSSWFGSIALRYVSEDFIKARCYGAGYWDTVAEFAGGPRPIHTFNTVLRVGSTGPDVVALQQLLISEKLLPPDCATGTFGGLTLAALHGFQNRYASEILIPQHLDKPTDTFGPSSIAKANQLCSPHAQT